MHEIIFAFLTAFALTFLSLPSIIRIARKKHLVDEPGERASHQESTPSLGGIGIFAGVMVSILLWTPVSVFSDLQYILGALVLIFLLGAKDDIDPIQPAKKLFGQLVAAGILVFAANVKLTSLYGIMGIDEISDLVAIPLSMFTIIVTINAFNLIDGINGLSGSIGLLIATVLGTWFFLTDNIALAIIAFALAGSCLAFLRFNITPAQIFMGDTGSLLLGLIGSILFIRFIESHNYLPTDSPYGFQSAPAVAIGIMILPLFDTLRVFVTRVAKGRSPLSPDRTHIHHLLLDSGLSHMQATGILILVNLAFILMVFLLQNMGSFYLMLVILFVATTLSYSLYLSVQRKKRRSARASEDRLEIMKENGQKAVSRVRE